MEIKKSSRANADKLRLPIALLGFLFVGGILLASFTYRSSIEQEIMAEVRNGSDNVVYSQEVKKPEIKPEPAKQEYVAPPQPKIIIDSISATTPKGTVTPPKPPIVIGTPEPPKYLPEPVKFPDTEAEFDGGAAELQKWISQNVVYPELSIEMEDQGKVYLSFVVEADGEITHIQVQKGVTKELDKEAKRVMRKMPKWIPGEVGGKRVRTLCSLPIVFTLK